MFQIAGGILLLFTGLAMVNRKGLRREDRSIAGDRAFQIAKFRFRDVIVPWAIPMLSGPGSLTTVLLHGSKINGVADLIFLSLVLLIAVQFIVEGVSESFPGLTEIS